jgi:hypothetical protein
VKTTDRKEDRVVSDTVRKEQEPLELLSEPWKQTLEKELELLDKERSLETGLLRDEIVVRKKYLGLWAEGQDTVDLSAYPQAKIVEAEEWLSEQQEKWEEERQDLLEEVKEVEGKVADQKKEGSDKAGVLLELLNQLKALPGSIKAAEGAVDRLAGELTQAKGTAREALVTPEYEAAKERLTRLSNPDHAMNLNAAIEEGLAEWQESKDKLKELVATGTDAARSQEDLQAGIKKIDKKAQYLKEHRDALVLEYLKRSVQE